MPDSNNSNPLSLTDAQATEIRMRKALGLTPGGSTLPAQQRPEQARQRHRFAQDGSVPVVVLNRSGDAEPGAHRERTSTLLAQLETERSAHAATRRSLQEAQSALQAMRTRLTHAELALVDAKAAGQRAQQQGEEALAEALAQLSSAHPAPTQAAPAQADEAPADPDVQAAPLPKRRSRKPRLAEPPREPQPVKWWTPGFRAKSRKTNSPT